MTVLQRAARRVASAVGQDSVIVRSARPVYERALNLLSGGRGIPWTINGAEFRISPFQRHRMGTEYDGTVAEFLRRRIRPGQTCVDVGANVGVYVLQLARWTGQRGRVVAFEPNPVSARVLGEHVLMNRMSAQVDIVEAAVADEPGIRTFHMADADGMSRLEAPNPQIEALTRAIDVSVTTLDAYCESRSLEPDWLLVDVEGFEFAVLAGARRTVSRRGPALHIVVEMHPDAWHVAGWTREAAAALLSDLGLEAISLTGLADPLSGYGHALLRPCPAGDPGCAA